MSRCAVRKSATTLFLRGCAWGGVWGGGGAPPQGHRPNDMVLCVCDLPYLKVFRGRLGVLGVLWGSRGARGRPGKGWAGPREVRGGALGGFGKGHFLFCYM